MPTRLMSVMKMKKTILSKSKLAAFSLMVMTSIANAAVIDLADTANASGTFETDLGSVVFTWGQIQTTGTGILDPFLRIQKNSEEQGYNSTQANAGAYPFEEKYGSFTHDVMMSDLVSSDGAYRFVLDIGEPGNDKSLLSLDGLKLFSTSTPGQNGSGVDANGDWLGPVNGTLLWDMDSDENGNYLDNHVLLDSNREGNPGNGISDMLMDVESSIISAAPGDEQYFVLWSRFGLIGVPDAESNGTFEEWSRVTAVSNIPEPSTALLFSLGLLGLVVATRRKKGSFSRPL